MSIFSLFRSSDEQEEVNNAYQAWRDENPDNLSDDDFYDDDDSDETDADDDDSDRKGWFGLW